MLDPETTQELERSFVRDLYGLLSAVDEYNRDHSEWKEQRTLQAYTYDSYEVKLLTDALLRRILDPEVADEALEVFLYFQQPELMQAQDHPASEVFFPVVTLIDVLRSLFALPIEVTYRFRDVVELFREGDGFEYRPNDYFSFELSNQMRSDAIYAIWTKGEDYGERIEREVRQRLFATTFMIGGIRSALETHGSPLFAWPPKFFLPGTYAYRHVVLSRLAFLARYESVLDYLAVRTRRMAPLEEQLRNGDTLRLTYRGARPVRARPPPSGPRHRRRWVPQLAPGRGRRRGAPRPAQLPRLRQPESDVGPQEPPTRPGRHHRRRGDRRDAEHRTPSRHQALQGDA